ncbi:atypical protein kinase C-like [Rhinophrynus dorsalis]
MPGLFRTLLGLCCISTSARDIELPKIKGHQFQSQRIFSAVCAVCRRRFWTKGYCCLTCNTVVHKRCHTLVHHCDKEQCRVPVRQEDLWSTPEAPSETDLLQKEDVATESSYWPLNSPMSLEDECAPVSTSPVVSSPAADDPVEDLNVKYFSQDWKNLEDFNIIKELGEGARSNVFLVQSKDYKKKLYAMKVMKKNEACEDKDFIITEKRIRYKAYECPFLVGVYYCIQTTSGRLCYFMDYLSGGNMQNHLLRYWKSWLPEDHVRFYAAELASAINFLQKRSIIHRNLTLGNLLLDRDGHLKVSDYGLCKEGIGTLMYAAPEVLNGKKDGFSMDWWALGIILFQLSTGRYPFTTIPHFIGCPEKMRAILKRSLKIPPFLSSELCLLLKGLLEKKPGKRLGGNSDKGFDEIQHHPFFNGMDWEKLEKKQIQPPYKPPLKISLEWPL